MSTLQGRPRKPVEILEASGAFVKNPNRRREQPPKSNHPAGDPPDYLRPEEQTIWREFLSDIPMGVATAPDRSALATMCMLESLKRQRQIKVIELNVLLKLYSLFGITPADRTRITAVTNTEDNAFAEFN